MSKAERTKNRILETAIELFNERGTKGVTTNHIAAAMGISPGNLYYHFRNKEGIIRAIFARMHEVGLSDYLEINAEQGAGSAASMEETFLMIQRFNWRYRFFKRELASLVQNDPELKKQFVASHRQHLDGERCHRGGGPAGVSPGGSPPAAGSAGGADLDDGAVLAQLSGGGWRGGQRGDPQTGQ